MTQDFPNITQARRLQDIHNAARFDVPIQRGHPYYTDFSDVRGDFEDRMIYKSMNVHPKTFDYLGGNDSAKSILFLAGMRGSGKTTELASIAQKMHHKDCFFVVICNLDQGLDVNDMEYMDILIYQLARLSQELAKYKEIPFEPRVFDSMQDWFSERIKEVNEAIRREKGFEIALEAKSPSILSFLGILGRFQSSLKGSKENADKVRTVLKNNFTEFSLTINGFFEEINFWLNTHDIAKELCFVVDGLEKVATPSIRERLFREESHRIHQIQANTIFTLPLELMSYRQALIKFSTVVSFPFVKIKEKDGKLVPAAMARFREFVSKRIDPTLFDAPSTIDHAIEMGGGSPRNLLRIIQYANVSADEDASMINRVDLDKGLRKLAAETAYYIENDELALLKILKENNEQGKLTPFGPEWQKLLESEIVLEYNDGTYKRVNPIVEISELYRQYVG